MKKTVKFKFGRKIISLLVVMVLILANMSFAFAEDIGNSNKYDWDNLVPGEDYVDGEMIVTFSLSVPDEDAMGEIVEKYGFSVKEVLSFTDKYASGKTALVSIDNGMTVREAIEVIEQDPMVRYASLNYIFDMDGWPEYPTPKENVSVEYDYDWENLIPGEDYVDGEMIVSFSLSVPDEKTMDEIARQWGCSVKEVLSFTDKYASGKTALLSINNGYSVPKAIKAIEYDWKTRYALPNMYFDLSDDIVEGPVTDPDAMNQWYITKIGADRAWNYVTCDNGVTVAVVDSGVDLSHEDLAENILTSYAWDAVNECALTAPGYVSDHGTHVAGIISAVSDNGIGIDGVSHNANIIPVNVFHLEENGNARANLADLHKGLDYLYSDVNCPTLKVINMSLGGPSRLIDQGPPVINIEEQINAFAAEGIVTVCSAGNTGDNSERFPSDYSGTISVMATDQNDNKASFSSYGWQKDMCAPGVNIWSTVPDGYESWNGTSMASPMVAGVAALMFAANPNLTVSQVRYILHDTAVDLGNAGQDEIYGWGRLNALDAVLRARDGYWKRLNGTDRYYTAQSISYEGWEDGSCDTVILASGEDFPDALSGTGLAGINDAPVILTKRNILSQAAANEITRLGATKVYIVGGSGVVSDDVKTSVEALPGVQQVIRIYGSTRYDTCVSVYQAGIGDWSDTLIIGTGMSPSDMLSVSPYAFTNRCPVFLADGNGNIKDSTKAVISGGSFSKAIIIGSSAIVNEATENYLNTYLGADNVMRIWFDQV